MLPTAGEAGGFFETRLEHSVFLKGLTSKEMILPKPNQTGEGNSKLQLLLPILSLLEDRTKLNSLVKVSGGDRSSVKKAKRQ